MTLAGWSFRKMPLQVPQKPIITEKKKKKKKKNGGVTTPSPLAVPDQYATVCPALCWMPSSTRVGLTTRPQALCEAGARPL
jgi:hypothetical protein